jgi:hypothetical protein
MISVGLIKQSARIGSTVGNEHTFVIYIYIHVRMIIFLVESENGRVNEVVVVEEEEEEEEEEEDKKEEEDGKLLS